MHLNQYQHLHVLLLALLAPQNQLDQDGPTAERVNKLYDNFTKTRWGS